MNFSQIGTINDLIHGHNLQLCFLAYLAGVII